MSISNKFISMLLKQVLTRLVGSVWEIMERVVAAYQNADLNDEDKKKAAIAAFKSQVVIEGKELSDSAVNFLLEAVVILFKLKQ